MLSKKIQEDSQYTYVNGLGFITQTPKIDEKKQMKSRYNFLYFAIIISHLMSIFLLYPLIKWLGAMGLEIGINPITNFVYKNDFSWQVTNLVLYIISKATPIILLYLAFKNDIKVSDFFTTPNKFSVRYGIMITIGACIVFNAMAYYINLFLHDFGIILSSAKTHFEMQDSPQAMVVYIISLTIIPAFFEEVLFRGIILTSLRKYGDFIAITASSILYAFTQTNAHEIIYSFLIGNVLAYFMLRSGSIIVVIFTNFIIKSLYMSMWIVKSFKTPYDSAIILLATMIMLFMAFVCFVKFVKKDKYAFLIKVGKTKISNREKLKYFITNIGFWILCSIVLIQCIQSMQIVE